MRSASRIGCRCCDSAARFVAAGGAGRELTVRQWLDQHGQSPRLCRMLWEPLALAALESVDGRGWCGKFSDGAVADVRPRARTPRRCCCRRCRSMSSGRSTARRPLLRSAGSQVTTNAPARVVVSEGRVAGVRSVRDCIPGSVGDCRGAVVCASPTSSTTRAGVAWKRIVANASALGSVADRDREPVVRCAAATRRVIVGLPGANVPVGLRQGPARRVIAVAPVAGRERRRRDLRGVQRELVATALDELAARCRPFGRRRCDTPSVVRERRATFSLRPGGPAAAVDAHTGRRAYSCRRLD